MDASVTRPLAFALLRMAGTMNAARPAAIDNPAPSTNAREYPAFRATGFCAACKWPAAVALQAESEWAVRLDSSAEHAEAVSAARPTPQ